MAEFKLPRKVTAYGYIMHKHWIIVFGGYTGSGWIDDIFILDISNKDKGWITANIKCPRKSVYRAILTSNKDIHLVDETRCGHYSISLVALLPNSE